MKNNRLLVGALWLMLVIAFLMVYTNIATDRISRWQFYNPDALYLPMVYQDIVTHVPLLGWRHPPAPYFFPDMLLYLLLNALTRNVHLAIMGYGLVQSLLWFGGMFWLSHTVFGKQRGLRHLVLLGGTIFFLLLGSGQCLAFVPILQNAYHFGAMLSLLGSLLLMAQIIKSTTTRMSLIWLALTLFALAVATTLSDAIYTVQLLLPALASCWFLFLCGRISPERLFAIYSALVPAVPVSAYISRAILIFRNLRPLSDADPEDPILSKMTHALTDILHWSEDVWVAREWLVILGGVWLVFMVSAGILAGGAIYQARKSSSQALSGWRFWVTLALLAISMVSVLASPFLRGQEWLLGAAFLPTGGWLLALIRQSRKTLLRAQHDEAAALLLLFFVLLSPLINIATTLAIDGSSPRYFQPAMLFPLFFGWPFLVGRFPKIVRILERTPFLLSALVITIACGWMSGGVATLKQAAMVRNLTDYYPELVRCLDEQAQHYQVRYGLAQYWRAKYITLLSKQSLQVVQVRHGDRKPLFPNHLISNFNWYDHEFEFIITDRENNDPQRLDQQKIQEHFGEPAATVTCDTKTMLIYNRPQDTAFQQQFREYFVQTYQAADLPSQTGRVTGASRIAEPVDASGYLMYGPYVELPIGDYAFELHYQATDLQQPKPNTWDVVIDPTYDPGLKRLQKGEIVQAGENVLRGEFQIRQLGKTEIRTYYAGHGTLRIDKIQIQRIR